MTLMANDNPPACFPEDLFGPPDSTDDAVWWVARTKSRQEKALAWDLQAKGLAYYLPLVAKPQKCRGRMRTSIVPLFNGYLFFKGNRQGRYDAMCSGRIAQIIEVEDQQGLCRELGMLAQVTATSLTLELFDFVKKGQKVRIINGPFYGLEGIVKKQKNRSRLILNVTAINQAAAVEIALEQVQPI